MTAGSEMWTWDDGATFRFLKKTCRQVTRYQLYNDFKIAPCLDFILFVTNAVVKTLNDFALAVWLLFLTIFAQSAIYSQ